jgi:hypothetical protein
VVWCPSISSPAPRESSRTTPVKASSDPKNNKETRAVTLYSPPLHFSHRVCSSLYRGRKSFRGFGTLVIELVLVLIKVRSCSRVGRWRDVSDSESRSANMLRFVSSVASSSYGIGKSSRDAFQVHFKLRPSPSKNKLKFFPSSPTVQERTVKIEM